MKESAIDMWEVVRELIIKQRDNLGISNYKLAEWSGLAESSVGRYLSGEVIPSVVALYQLLAALKIEHSYSPMNAPKKRKRGN